jgi:uncharacterized protein YcbK (DUF882 family)
MACPWGRGTAGRILFWRGSQQIAHKPGPVRGRVGALLKIGAAALLITFAAQARSFAEDRALKLYNLHTHERAIIVFKRNGVYDRSGLSAINEFLRDWRENRVTHMDPHLLDLVWQVYKQSGSHDYIQVVCGYRSPPTNASLRRRSSGVAKNSQHMLGKAMDFFIPDVPLAKLRAIGLRMQLGGVGFYPTSGSPFVHMDTGGVRHWPRMTREQLVRVFPNGNTIHVPSDGRPLPGYEQALAAYKARISSETPTTRVASFAGKAVLEDAQGEPSLVADLSVPDDEVDDAETTSPAAVSKPVPVVAAAAPPTPAASPVGRAVGTAVASYVSTSVPMPRLAPRRPQSVAVASLAPPAEDITAPARPPLDIATLASLPLPDGPFADPDDWAQPQVPATLAAAMAQRDQTRRNSSLPIAPTAVVATIDVSRPLRAEAITTAVLRNGGYTGGGDVAGLLAYAPASLAEAPAGRDLRAQQKAPVIAASAPAPASQPTTPAHMMAPPLTMTALDTRSLRMWIGTESTRQKSYAVLTMPDFATDNTLMRKPDVALAAGFGGATYSGLRTDHFSGPLVAQPDVVDLRQGAFVAAR